MPSQTSLSGLSKVQFGAALELRMMVEKEAALINSAREEGKESFVHKLFVVTDRAFAENKKCCKLLLGIFLLRLNILHVLCSST